MLPFLPPNSVDMKHLQATDLCRSADRLNQLNMRKVEQVCVRMCECVYSSMCTCARVCMYVHVCASATRHGHCSRGQTRARHAAGYQRCSSAYFKLAPQHTGVRTNLVVWLNIYYPLPGFFKCSKVTMLMLMLMWMLMMTDGWC